MAVYTVFEPPRRDGAELADRFVFIRDRFTWSAFLFGPLWMLRHGLWLVLLAYLLGLIALGYGLGAVGLSGDAGFIVLLLVALLVGFEAPTLRRWTMLRRGWTDHGVVIADDRDTAERRFFDAWSADRPERGLSEPPAPPRPRPLSPGRSDIIGLFPEPGRPR